MRESLRIILRIQDGGRRPAGTIDGELFASQVDRGQLRGWIEQHCSPGKATTATMETGSLDETALDTLDACMQRYFAVYHSVQALNILGLQSSDTAQIERQQREQDLEDMLNTVYASLERCVVCNPASDASTKRAFAVWLSDKLDQMRSSLASSIQGQHDTVDGQQQLGSDSRSPSSKRRRLDPSDRTAMKQLKKDAISSLYLALLTRVSRPSREIHLALCVPLHNAPVISGSNSASCKNVTAESFLEQSADKHESDRIIVWLLPQLWSQRRGWLAVYLMQQYPHEVCVLALASVLAKLSNALQSETGIIQLGDLMRRENRWTQAQFFDAQQELSLVECVSQEFAPLVKEVIAHGLFLPYISMSGVPREKSALVALALLIIVHECEGVVQICAPSFLEHMLEPSSWPVLSAIETMLYDTLGLKRPCDVPNHILLLVPMRLGELRSEALIVLERIESMTQNGESAAVSNFAHQLLATIIGSLQRCVVEDHPGNSGQLYTDSAELRSARQFLVGLNSQDVCNKWNSLDYQSENTLSIWEHLSELMGLLYGIGESINIAKRTFNIVGQLTALDSCSEHVRQMAWARWRRLFASFHNRFPQFGHLFVNCLFTEIEYAQREPATNEHDLSTNMRNLSSWALEICRSVRSADFPAGAIHPAAQNAERNILFSAVLRNWKTLFATLFDERYSIASVKWKLDGLSLIDAVLRSPAADLDIDQHIFAKLSKAVLSLRLFLLRPITCQSSNGKPFESDPSSSLYYFHFCNQNAPIVERIKQLCDSILSSLSFKHNSIQSNEQLFRFMLNTILSPHMESRQHSMRIMSMQLEEQMNFPHYEHDGWLSLFGEFLPDNFGGHVSALALCDNVEKGALACQGAKHSSTSNIVMATAERASLYLESGETTQGSTGDALLLSQFGETIDVGAGNATTDGLTKQRLAAKSSRSYSLKKMAEFTAEGNTTDLLEIVASFLFPADGKADSHRNLRSFARQLLEKIDLRLPVPSSHQYEAVLPKKPTFERNIVFDKMLARFPILHDLIQLVSHEPREFASFTQVVNGDMLASIIGEWNRLTPPTSGKMARIAAAKHSSKPRELLERTCTILSLMHKCQWIRPPLSFAGEILPKLHPSEVTGILLSVWRFVDRYPPRVEEYDANTGRRTFPHITDEREYTRSFKAALRNHVDEFATLFGRYAS